MYVVKLRYKNSNENCYANEALIREIGEIRDDDDASQVKWYTLPLAKARNLFMELINRNCDPEIMSFWSDTKMLDYIAIVELSNYAPHREYQVLDYKEFP